jgi:hypothetical protein
VKPQRRASAASHSTWTWAGPVAAVGGREDFEEVINQFQLIFSRESAFAATRFHSCYSSPVTGSRTSAQVTLPPAAADQPHPARGQHAVRHQPGNDRRRRFLKMAQSPVAQHVNRVPPRVPRCLAKRPEFQRWPEWHAA